MYGKAGCVVSLQFQNITDRNFGGFLFYFSYDIFSLLESSMELSTYIRRPIFMSVFSERIHV